MVAKYLECLNWQETMQNSLSDNLGISGKHVMYRRIFEANIEFWIFLGGILRTP
jgi:hypothetical protein